MHTEDSPEEPTEHARSGRHLIALEQVADGHAVELVRCALTGPDQVMAQAAVVRHLDRRAAELCPEAVWRGWAGAMALVAAGRPFLMRRLREWSLFRSVALRLPWHRGGVLAASEWLRLRTAAGSNPEALAVLAGHGRTKGIRSTARAGLTLLNPA
ncbi:hypothetical protein OR263_08325 [Streptomyces sp. NEAU-H22]|uniref:hypothetical protein n=1 Tax=Streptomyces sp. NEAU-H22 TaxID=2994655 RepID=UPI00224E17B8|nr:hypothetical protein [Streptomyces sp. NEAU-H22]MCX3286718.1 hypothetical protein [Streptomyces sp. NEAU-H22]